MLHLIFDLDGCLIDSKEVQQAALRGSYDEIVGDDNCPTYEEYIRYTGDSVDNVLRKLGLPAAMATPFRRISSAAVDKIIVNWDAMELIRWFRSQGSRIAICTGKDRNRTEDILHYYGITELFDVLICGDDVSEPKPSSMPIREALLKLKISVHDAVMIGDGVNDLLAARSAGVKFILTTWYNDATTVETADYIVGSVSELQQALLGICQKL